VESDLEEVDEQDDSDAAEVGSEVAVVDWVDSHASVSDALIAKARHMINLDAVNLQSVQREHIWK
jgi:hypothetical protein